MNWSPPYEKVLMVENFWWAAANLALAVALQHPKSCQSHNWTSRLDIVHFGNSATCRPCSFCFCSKSTLEFHTSGSSWRVSHGGALLVEGWFSGRFVARWELFLSPYLLESFAKWLDIRWTSQNSSGLTPNEGLLETFAKTFELQLPTKS